MTPEGKVKEKIKRWLDLNMPGHWRVMPRGGPFGKAGCPDILICWQGIFIAIEVKSDDGDPTPLQIANLKQIKNAGGVAALVRGYDVVRLNAIKSAAEEPIRLIRYMRQLLIDLGDRSILDRIATFIWSKFL